MLRWSGNTLQSRWGVFPDRHWRQYDARAIQGGVSGCSGSSGRRIQVMFDLPPNAVAQHQRRQAQGVAITGSKCAGCAADVPTNQPRLVCLNIPSRPNRPGGAGQYTRMA